MKLYCIEPPVDQWTEEGLDVSEWYTSLQRARRRFTEIKRQYVHGDSGLIIRKLKLKAVEIADYPKKQLLVRLLNRAGYIKHEETIEEWEVPWPERVDCESCGEAAYKGPTCEICGEKN